MRRLWLAVVVAVVAASTMSSAQAPGKPAAGNPTPGIAQPDPPNLADRVTFVGCLQTVTRGAEASASAQATADRSASADTNAPSNARFELTRAERVDRVPAGTGGSPATASVSSKAFRLEGIDSQFSPFVGTKVEVSGGIKAAASVGPPILAVEFVQKLAATCS